MGTTQQFCLKWNNYSTNLVAVFESFMLNETFSDVTLACEGLFLKAHKVILSACSPFFQNLFTSHPCKHPIIILNNINYSDLKACIEFMYKGEVNVAQSSLSTLLKTAETLKVKGLAEVSSDLANNPNIHSVNSDENKTSQPKSVSEPLHKRLNHEIPLETTLPLITPLDESRTSLAAVVNECVVSEQRSPNVKSRKRKKTRYHGVNKKMDNRDSEQEGYAETDEDDYNRTEDSNTQGSDDSTNKAQSLIPALTIGRSEDIKPTVLVTYQEPSRCASPNDTSSQSHLSLDDSNSAYLDSSLSISAGPSNLQQENRQILPAGSSQGLLYSGLADSRNDLIRFIRYPKNLSLKGNILVQSTSSSNTDSNSQETLTCNICNKYFSSKGTLKRHIKLHNSQELVACDICKREFNRADNLREHKRRVHNLNLL